LGIYEAVATESPSPVLINRAYPATVETFEEDHWWGRLLTPIRAQLRKHTAHAVGCESEYERSYRGRNLRFACRQEGHDLLLRGRALISLCICTYNRSESLWRTLNSLAGQNNINVGALEVLVVDNNCTDGTPEVVEAFREKLPIRRITENQQGLAHARNRAVAEFRGDVLLFTDDDMELAPGWLAAYGDAINTFPDAEYFGGRILPGWENFKPRWIRDKPLPLLDGILGWFDYGVETRPYGATDQGPVGGSFGVRRRLFERAGGFRPDLGRVGVDFGRGEETEFIHRAKHIGAKGIYVGQSLCWHTIDRHRLGLLTLFRYGIASGRARQSVSAGERRGPLARTGSFLLRGVFQLMKGRGDRFRQCIINAGIEIGSMPFQSSVDRVTGR
jgi:glucosyl-dolichyl phosphate glucuronosyltransferase